MKPTSAIGLAQSLQLARPLPDGDVLIERPGRLAWISELEELGIRPA
jgi:hypothetical protein